MKNIEFIMCDAYLELAKYHVPILPFPMPSAGSTGPASLYSDTAVANAESLMEKVFSALPLVLSGVDVINGTGEIDTSQLLVLEQIVVDHEIACMCKRFKDGIDVSDAKDRMNDIVQVGPGGHFLMQPSTVKACRSDEFYTPALSDRNTFDRWEALGSPTLYGNARKRVEEILAGPLKNPLPDDVLGKLEDIVRRANEELPSET